MNDEDFVMGYAVGYNDVKIVEKTIIENGTYHAADDGADGFDPVHINVPSLTKEELDKLIEWIIQQIMPQLPDGTPEPVLPEIIVGDLRPTVDGYDKPFLLSEPDGGKTSQVMYGVSEIDSSGRPTKHYYVDTFVNGVLSRHASVLIIPNEGVTNFSHINSDGTITTIRKPEGGQSTTVTHGPYITGSGNTVWSI